MKKKKSLYNINERLKMKPKKMNPENITKDKQYGINPMHDQNGKKNSI